jgi:hypothetical protein
VKRSLLRIFAIGAAGLGALAGVLVASLPSGAASPHATAAASTKTVYVRGPRGFRGPEGPRGGRGPQGATGPQGPSDPNGAAALSLTVNWFKDSGGDPTTQGHDAPITIPGIGTMSVACDYNSQQVVLTPYSNSTSGTRTVANVTTFQGAGYAGASQNLRYESYGSQIVIPLPSNGMLSGTLSVEPTFGAGGAGPTPSSFTFSSFYKLNGGQNGGDECEVAGQVAAQSS